MNYESTKLRTNFQIAILFGILYIRYIYTYKINIYINHIKIQIKPFCILFFTLLLIVPKYYRSLSHSLTLSLSLSLLATMLINSSNILFSWCEIIQWEKDDFQPPVVQHEIKNITRWVVKLNREKHSQKRVSVKDAGEFSSMLSYIIHGTRISLASFNDNVCMQLKKMHIWFL